MKYRREKKKIRRAKLRRGGETRSGNVVGGVKPPRQQVCDAGNQTLSANRGDFPTIFVLLSCDCRSHNIGIRGNYPFSQTVGAINAINTNNINIAATDDFASGLYLSISLFIRQAAKYLIRVGSVLTQQNKNVNFGN